MRCVASLVCCVVFHLFHVEALQPVFARHFPPFLNALTHYGSYGLQIFFLLSGFVLTMLVIWVVGERGELKRARFAHHSIFRCHFLQLVFGASAEHRVDFAPWPQNNRRQRMGRGGVAEVGGRAKHWSGPAFLRLCRAPQHGVGHALQAKIKP